MNQQYMLVVEAAKDFLEHPRSKKSAEALRHAIGTKICAGCQERKPLEAFGPKKEGFDGYRSRCNKCRSETRM